MIIESINRVLKKASLAVVKESRLPNDSGIQLRLENGAIINIFDNGTVQFQGKKQTQMKSLIEPVLGDISERSIKVEESGSDKVFVVYGHDTTAKVQLEATLRRWGLDPIILDQLPSEGATLIEKLEIYYKEVSFAVVLATPDDEGNRVGHSDEMAYRARQNVVLELGMLLAHLGRERVAILLKNQDEMEKPSDIQGLIYIPFKNDIAKEAGLLLAKEMVRQGYEIDVANI